MARTDLRWMLVLCLGAMWLGAGRVTAAAPEERRPESGGLVCQYVVGNTDELLSGEATELRLTPVGVSLPPSTALRLGVYRLYPRMDFLPDGRMDFEPRHNARLTARDQNADLTLPVRGFAGESGVGWFRVDIAPDTRQAKGIQKEFGEAFTGLGCSVSFFVGDAAAALSQICDEYVELKRANAELAESARIIREWVEVKRQAAPTQKALDEYVTRVDECFEAWAVSSNARFSAAKTAAACDAGLRFFGVMQAFFKEAGDWDGGARKGFIGQTWPSTPWPAYDSYALTARVDNYLELLFHWQAFAAIGVERESARLLAESAGIAWSATPSVSPWSKLSAASEAVRILAKSAWPEATLEDALRLIPAESSSLTAHYQQAAMKVVYSGTLPDAIDGFQAAMVACRKAAHDCAADPKPSTRQAAQAALAAFGLARETLMQEIIFCQSCRVQTETDLERSRRELEARHEAGE